MQPEPFDRRAEVERLLELDETVLGRFWRYEQQGLTAQQMADEEGTVTAGWVSNYRTLVAIVRDGLIPPSPSQSRNGAGRIRGWLKRTDLSERLRAELVAQESLLTSRAEDSRAVGEEVEEAVEATRAAESSGIPGVYVYTLPHYLNHPYDPKTGRTLLKVGHSSVDAVVRAETQGRRLTALPEDPMLLRIYPVQESQRAEATFHAWLRDADHDGSRGTRAGAEWFLTSPKFLDRIARSLDLEVRVVNEFEVPEW